MTNPPYPSPTRPFPHPQHTKSLPVKLLYLLRKCYVWLCRLVFSFPQRCFVSMCDYVLTLKLLCSWRVVLCLLVLLSPVFFLKLMSLVFEKPMGFAVDEALLRQVLTVGPSDLCWQKLWRRPFVFLRSLDMEVGQIVKGTLVFKVPAVAKTYSSEATVRWRRKRRETRDSRSQSTGSEKTLGFALDPSPYSHTEAQSVVETRVNQIMNPLTVDNKVSNTNTHSPPSSHQPATQPHSATRVHFARPQRFVSPNAQSLLELDSQKDTRTHNPFLGHAQAGVENMVLGDVAQDSSKRTEKLANNLETQNKKPNYIRDQEKTDNNQGFHVPNNSHSDSVKAKNKHTARSPEKSSLTDSFLTKPSKQLLYDHILVTSRSWEPLADDDDNIFVYSAFYDDRLSLTSESGSRRRVRVLGVSDRQTLRDLPQLKRHVFCHFRWRSNPDLYVSQGGTILSVEDGLNTTYHAIFIMCDLHLCASPDYVGITVDRQVLPRSYLPVQYPPPIGQRLRHDITSCLPIIHSGYSDQLELLQVLEADRLLGSQKVTIYVHSATPEVMAILRHYVVSGVMEAIQWHLPFPDKNQIGSLGQLVAVNDCLYSSMYISHHVVFHDLDQLLLPRQHFTWRSMLEELHRQEEASWWEWWRRKLGGDDYGSYIFLHVTFPNNCTDSGQQGDTDIQHSDGVDHTPYVYSAVDDSAPLPHTASDNVKWRESEHRESNEKEQSGVTQQKAEDRKDNRRTKNEGGERKEERKNHQRDGINVEIADNRKGVQQLQIQGTDVKYDQQKKTAIQVGMVDTRKGVQRLKIQETIVNYYQQKKLGVASSGVSTEKHKRRKLQSVDDRNFQRTSLSDSRLISVNNIPSQFSMSQSHEMHKPPNDRGCLHSIDSAHNNSVDKAQSAAPKQVPIVDNEGDKSSKGNVLKELSISDNNVDKISKDQRDLTSLMKDPSSSNNSVVNSSNTGARKASDFLQLDYLRNVNHYRKLLRVSDKDNTWNIIVNNMTFLRCSWREDKVWPPGLGSRLLVKPAAVEVMGLHAVLIHVKGYQSKVLPPHITLLRHYPKWRVEKGTVMVRDTMVHNFSSRLANNVVSVLKNVTGE